MLKAKSFMCMNLHLDYITLKMLFNLSTSYVHPGYNQWLAPHNVEKAKRFMFMNLHLDYLDLFTLGIPLVLSLFMQTAIDGLRLVM